jgi:hypothetical protein
MPGWTFAPRIGAYRDPDGQAHTLAAVREAVDARVAASQENMRSMARDYTQGRISLVRFEGLMRDEIKTLHVQTRVIGVGGPDMVTQSDYGKAGHAIRDEYAYLHGFVADIEAGRHSDAGIEDRAGKYAGASAINEFEDGRRGVMAAQGFDLKRRVGPNDAHTCEECAAEIAQGWVDIEEPGWEIGDTTCQSNDRCTIEYSRSSDAGAPGD